MLYELIKGVDTVAVDQRDDYEGWIYQRTLGIGGSDVGTIMGCNPFETKLSLYLAKKRIDGFAGNNHTMWGHIMEAPIREYTAHELGVTIEEVPVNLRSQAHPFMLANLDGLMMVDKPEGLVIGGEVVRGLGGHEIKTTSRGDGFSECEIPDSYYWQVQHYMAVTGLDWFVLTAFNFSSKTAQHYLVQRNEEHIQQMIAAEKAFWENHVEANNPPEPEGGIREGDAVRALPVGGNIVLSDAYEPVLDELEAIKQEVKELKERETKLKTSLILAMAEAGNGEQQDKNKVTCGKYVVTYNVVKRGIVDRDELKKAGLLDQFTKESISKELRVSPLKG